LGSLSGCILIVCFRAFVSSVVIEDINKVHCVQDVSRKNGFRSPSNCKCFYGQQYMYLLYILSCTWCEELASLSLRAYEALKKDMERIRKVYTCTTFNHSSPLIYLHLTSTFTITSATKVASWLSKEHHQTRKAMRRPVGATFFALSGGEGSSLDLNNSFNFFKFSRTTLLNRRWSTFTTPGLSRPTTLSKFDVY
jgi:hypothetical protein